MSVDLPRQIARRSSGRQTCFCLAVVLVPGLLLGCDGGDSSRSHSDDGQAEQPAETQQRLPTLTFAGEVRAAYPEVGVFLDVFLNTCLAGDYAGYRRLVSRAYPPENRERFEAIYKATEAVTVESIERIETSRVAGDVYRVISTVELSPQQQVKLRQTRRKIAILVFKEGQEWRMAPAPAELQPHDEPPPTTTSAPTASPPSYPWDEEGDY